MIGKRLRLALVLVLLPFALPTFSSAAELDPTFGDGGTVTYEHGGSLELASKLDEYAGQPYALAIDSQGRILVGGGAGSDMLVVRLLPDGSLDQTFASGGAFRMCDTYVASNQCDPEINAPRVRSILIKPDGGILLLVRDFIVFKSDQTETTTQTSDVEIALDSNGALAPVFPDGATGVIGGLLHSETNSATLLADGSVVSVGRYDGPEIGPDEESKVGYVLKRNPDGSGDQRFGTVRSSSSRSWGLTAFEAKAWPFYEDVKTVKPVKGGKLLISGHDRNRFYVARLNRFGALDRTFGNRKSPGKSISNFGGKKCLCVVGGFMAVNSKGQMIQAGSSSYPAGGQTSVALVRYEKNGKLDRTFGKNGFSWAISKPYVRVTSVAVQRNGKILVGAKVRSLVDSKFALFRFLPNGDPDKSFFKNGRYVVNVGERSSADRIIIDDHGRAVVAGGAVLNGIPSFIVKRFNLGG